MDQREKVRRTQCARISYFSWVRCTARVLTLLVTGPQGSIWIARPRPRPRADTYSQLNLFGEVFERVRTDYVEKPDDSKLIEGAINGMVTSLDPHSRYMNDKAWHEMQETTHGEFGGLGIEVTMEDGLVKVVAPIDDTPAAKAGILSGDLITQIDDENVQGLTLEQAVNKMKGAGQHQDQAEDPAQGHGRADRRRRSSARSSRCARSAIHTDGGDIGYIRITSFNEQTTDGLKKAIADISKEIPQDKLAGYVRRPPQQSRRIARPGGLGVEHVHGARRGGLDPRPHPRGNPALHRARRRPHQGQAAGRADQRRLGIRLRDRRRRACMTTSARP